MKDDTDIHVTIVVVSWNTRDLLAQCLTSIKEQAGDVSTETIVVDNASSDGSAKMVESQFPWVKLMRNETNVGFARANNRGIREANGHFILLLNPDTIILDGAIEKTVAFMEDTTGVGIATCKVLNDDRSFQTCYGEHFPGLWMLITGGTNFRATIGSLFMTQSYRHQAGISDAEINHSHPVAWVMGAFMMIRRDVVEQIGLLDENLFMYGEEPDYCYRAKKAGWERWYTSSGQIIHLGGESTSQVEQRRSTDWLMTTYFYFFRKHHNPLYVLSCYVLGLVSSIGKAVIFTLLLVTSMDEQKREKRANKVREHMLTTEWYLVKPVRLIRRRFAQ